METRALTEIPLLNEQPLSEILGARLPTKSEVFRHFFYLRNVQDLTIGEAVKRAVQAAKPFWVQAGVTVKHDRCAINDLEKIITEYKVTNCCGSQQNFIGQEP